MNSTYKLTPAERLEVGILKNMGLWSNASIGRAYGINRAAVSRHGKRVASLKIKLTQSQ